MSASGEGVVKRALAPVAAFLASFLASSHHAVHMALLSVGIGASGLTYLMTPGVRRTMIVVAVASVAFSLAWLARRKHRSGVEIAGTIAASIVSLVLVAVSVVRVGW